MKLKECVTCGSHEFNGNKCAYCGNVYENEPTWDDILKKQEQGIDLAYYYSDDEELTYPPIDEDFSQTETGKKILKVMIWLLVSIIWFAVTVCIPPLFLLTICCLIIWACKWLIKKGKNNS